MQIYQLMKYHRNILRNDFYLDSEFVLVFLELLLAKYSTTFI